MKNRILIMLYVGMMLVFVCPGFAAGAEQKAIHPPVPNKEAGTDVYLGPRVQHVREYRSNATSAGQKAREAAAVRWQNTKKQAEMNKKPIQGGGP